MAAMEVEMGMCVRCMGGWFGGGWISESQTVPRSLTLETLSSGKGRARNRLGPCKVSELGRPSSSLVSGMPSITLVLLPFIPNFLLALSPSPPPEFVLLLWACVLCIGPNLFSEKPLPVSVCLWPKVVGMGPPPPLLGAPCGGLPVSVAAIPWASAECLHVRLHSGKVWRAFVWPLSQCFFLLC